MTTVKRGPARAMKSIRVKQAKCAKCGHAWLPKREKPKQCPKCHDRLWWQKHVYHSYKERLHEFTGLMRKGPKPEQPQPEPEPAGTASAEKEGAA